MFRIIVISSYLTDILKIIGGFGQKSIGDVTVAMLAVARGFSLCKLLEVHKAAACLRFKIFWFLE